MLETIVQLLILASLPLAIIHNNTTGPHPKGPDFDEFEP